MYKTVIISIGFLLPNLSFSDVKKDFDFTIIDLKCTNFAVAAKVNPKNNNYNISNGSKSTSFCKKLDDNNVECVSLFEDGSRIPMKYSIITDSKNILELKNEFFNESLSINKEAFGNVFANTLTKISNGTNLNIIANSSKTCFANYFSYLDAKLLINNKLDKQINKIRTLGGSFKKGWEKDLRSML